MILVDLPMLYLSDTFLCLSLLLGDGVNDVAAMKMADVSVSLLNGYGQETGGSSGGWDTEEDRRRHRQERRDNAPTDEAKHSF